MLKGVARALSSGPATSWYVDTLHAVEGRDADLRPGLAWAWAVVVVVLPASVPLFVRLPAAGATGSSPAPVPPARSGSG